MFWDYVVFIQIILIQLYIANKSLENLTCNISLQKSYCFGNKNNGIFPAGTQYIGSTLFQCCVPAGSLLKKKTKSVHCVITE